MARKQAIYNHTLISLRAWEEYLKNYAGAAPLCLVSSDRSLFSLHAANFFLPEILKYCSALTWKVTGNASLI